MEEGCKSGDDFSSDSSFDDDIDNISLLPDIERKPSRLRRRRIHLFTDRSFDFNGRMCSKTVVYTTVTAVLLVSVVFISIFVKPSSSEEFEENVPEKRSSKEPGPDIPPEDNKKIYKDKTGKEFPWQEIRLPNKVIPEKYRVEIQTDLTTFKFKGHVDMLLKCEEKTDYIFFHAKHMHLKNYSLYELGHHEIPKTLELGEITESTELEMISVKVSQELEPGKQYVLYVEFNSSLADQLFGFYKSSYKTKNGETRHIATTHFEPTDARAAFPCMDEPALKAKFEIIIIRERQYTALSNMPLKETINVVDDGREFEKDIFEESVLMSTYLVAFVVCDFKSKSARTTSNTLVRVWAPPDNIDEADFALEEAKNILAYYEEFFKVKFPLPKQDLIAIPDFAAGAMENWGLITYRSTSLLFDKNESSDSNKQWVATVVAHELAHQWFGNLVTMKWWNDLWLNEGFASFVENIGASHDNPQWKMMDQFLLDKAQLAMNLDQMSNSHPISVPVHNPSEINALFDTISYDKGASIIRMLRSIIGKEAFRHGLQNYLETYKFGNAETKDLWGKLSKAWQVSDSNARDISTIMDTWTLQMGYPVVNITRDNNQLTAAQQHFLIHPREKPALVSPYGYKWEIPLTYSTQVDKQELYVWMGKDGKDVVINLPAQSGWFKANYGQKGFYRVNYDKENWEALTQQLKADHTALSDADRSGLIDDAFSLARAGQLKLQTALELTLYLTKEKEYVPWTSALNNLGYIHSMLCTDDAPFNTMKKYLLQQLSPIVEELGWQDEGTHLQKYLRASALKSAVEYGHENAKNEAMRIFNEWKNSGKRIAPNLRAIIYSIGVQHGGKENYDFVFKQYKTATVASEKRKLMYALSSSEDLTVLQDLLDKSLDSAVVRSQDSVAVINAVAGNCKGRFLAWNFTKQHWGLLYKRYAAGSFDFSRLVLRTTSHFNTQIMLNEVKSFFDSHPLGSGKRASKQSLESIQANIDWMKRNKDTAVNWMGANTLMTPIEDVEKTLQQLEHINPNMADHEDRGYARNDYYYQDREEPRYGSDDYYRETGDNYRYEYR